jgi:hypothetical protein
MVEPEDYPRLKRSMVKRWNRETSQVNVVFAQGKTGTSTLAAGLKRAGLHPVFQIHTLNARVLGEVEAEYVRRRSDKYPRHVWEAQWLNEHLPGPRHPWVIVTSVREPIARIVSRFFQQKSRFGDLRERPTADALIAELSTQFDRQARRLGGIGWDWFDAELKGVLGQSVYDTPFDPAVGFGTIETTHARLLLLRGESLDKAPEALGSLFGIDPIATLSAENVGTAKDYGPLYREVLDRFRPPAEYVARVYETKQARHFYSPEELEAFRRHWTRPISVPSG